MMDNISNATLYQFIGCEALTIPTDSNVNLPSTATVTIASSILGADSIPGLGSPITFYLWSLQQSTMFFSDDVLSRVAGWYSTDDCGGTLRYQSAKVSVWATFTNEEAAVNITADVTAFVHEVSAKTNTACVDMHTYIHTHIHIVFTVLHF